MNDEDLLGYLIGALEPDELTAIETRLQSSPETRERLKELRRSLLPLEAALEPGFPPLGLAERTIALLKSHLAALEANALPASDVLAPSTPVLAIDQPLNPAALRVAEAVERAPDRSLPRAPRDEPEIRRIGGRFRPDLLVACGIAFFACGLLFTAIGKARSQYQLLACQANLRTLHVALTGYAETHDGRYPQISADSTADSFAATLDEAGQLPAGSRVGCPAEPSRLTQDAVAYTYSLGFVTPTGGLVGLRRPVQTVGESDLMPIAADFPTQTATPTAGPLCAHAPVMNVLCVGGNVRSTTSPLIGPNGDDIYRNLHGQVAAGVGQADVVLGRPGDRP